MAECQGIPKGSGFEPPATTVLAARLRALPIRNDGNGIGLGYIQVPLGMRDELLALFARLGELAGELTPPWKRWNADSYVMEQLRLLAELERR